uniref:Serine-threonine/tyrosine-protein kinase catalytic domain-containing protein n=1 Tax=Tanacetum cinerariifolium TaxID=118510 RepID=A0A6L2MXB4_TANCI|nr:serine-threonine/tyrosine-protein kinase catalytic domain-containing protein [Tanacetum cinerariifolium]
MKKSCMTAMWNLIPQPLFDDVIHESKKRKRKANLVTWKKYDVIEIESSNDETIFDGDDDTLDDLLSMF